MKHTDFMRRYKNTLGLSCMGEMLLTLDVQALTSDEVNTLVADVINRSRADNDMKQRALNWLADARTKPSMILRS